MEMNIQTKPETTVVLSSEDVYHLVMDLGFLTQKPHNRVSSITHDFIMSLVEANKLNIDKKLI